MSFIEDVLLKKAGNIPGKAKLAKNVKYVTAHISLLALGVTFELCCEHVPEMLEEIKDWEDGRRVTIKVLPLGPSITIEKRGERINFLGMGEHDPHLSLVFKNLDSAILIFTAQLGAHSAVAENRVGVHGDNSKAMQVTRAMSIVQTYLFPGILLNMSFKRPPKLTPQQMVTKAKIMGLLTPRLVKASIG